MPTLNELMKIKGVVLALEFTPDGKLIDCKAKEEALRDKAPMAAQFCATVSMNFNTLAGAFTQLTKMSWVPQQGWTYTGGDYTVFIGASGSQGVFIETAQMDFNRLFEILIGES